MTLTLLTGKVNLFPLPVIKWLVEATDISAVVRKNLNNISIQLFKFSSGSSISFVLKTAPGRYSVDIQCPDQLYGELVEIVEENIEITLPIQEKQLCEISILSLY